MAHLIYSTESVEYGPWFVSESQLHNLDELAREEQERLEQDYTRQVESRANELIKEGCDFRKIGEENIADEENLARAMKRVERSPSLWGDSRQVVVQFAGGKRLVVDSFAEASKHPDAVTESPIAFYLTLARGDVRAEMRVEEEGRLYLRVSPEELSVSREVFVSLRQWVESVRAGLFLRTWCKLAYYEAHNVPLLLVALVAVLVLVVGGVRRTREPWTYEQRAEKLLSQGVESGKENEALETVLALLSDYERPPEQVSFVRPEGWVLGALAVVAAAAVILLFPPRTAIALGVGKAKLRRWRKWIKFISVSLPTVLFASFIWPVCVELIKHLFSV